MIIYKKKCFLEKNSLFTEKVKWYVDKKVSDLLASKAI